MRAAPRLAAGIVVALCAVLALGSAADGSTLQVRPAPGAPDPRLMVLTSADLRGAKVVRQGYYKDPDFPSVISYGRDLEDGRLGSVPVPFVSSDAEVGTSVATTARFLTETRRIFGTRAFRNALAESFAEELDLEGLVTKIQVGQPRALGVGPGSFDLPISMRVLGLRTDVHIAVFRVERVLGAMTAVGVPGRRLTIPTMTRMARIMAGRMTTQLTPRNTALPVVSGTPSVGQTLTASTGTWAGAPATYVYAWERCDAAGMGCAAIPGANAPTYVLQPGDSGATMRVAVTARNDAGSSSAASAVTGVVASAPGSPTSTAPPTISGTAAVGQTLTASTGSWAGSPSSFAFQWQRCNAAGSNCAAVAGATGQTYVVGTGDVGSTLRVVVTATNAAGATPASSAQTAVVA
jgi:hypothetical protein